MKLFWIFFTITNIMFQSTISEISSYNHHHSIDQHSQPVPKEDGYYSYYGETDKASPQIISKNIPISANHGALAPAPQAYSLIPVPQPYPVEVPRPVPVTVTRTVPVPIPQPYKVPVAVPIQVPVPQPYPISVPQPYPVKVPHIVRIPQPINIGGGGFGNGGNFDVYHGGFGKPSGNGGHKASYSYTTVQVGGHVNP